MKKNVMISALFALAVAMAGCSKTPENNGTITYTIDRLEKETIEVVGGDKTVTEFYFDSSRENMPNGGRCTINGTEYYTETVANVNNHEVTFLREYTDGFTPDDEIKVSYDVLWHNFYRKAMYVTGSTIPYDEEIYQYGNSGYVSKYENNKNGYPKLTRNNYEYGDGFIIYDIFENGSPVINKVVKTSYYTGYGYSKPKSITETDYATDLVVEQTIYSYSGDTRTGYITYDTDDEATRNVLEIQKDYTKTSGEGKTKITFTLESYDGAGNLLSETHYTREYIQTQNILYY